MTDFIGKKLGQYEIQKELGHGGMATVYIGYQALVDRKVAIKVLPPHPGLNDQFTERFQLEARTIANLQHPHILQLFDYGITEDKVLYLVMPYVDGGSLDRYMSDGAMDLRTIERLLRTIAGALDYAHRQGIVHRDIKPANIILDGEGNAFVADFGIAKIMSSSSNLTGTGVVGTPAYMSPEQAQGLDLDSRSDIYSLGVMVYEMLTGRPPFQSDTPMQIVLKHINEPPPNPTEALSGLPSGLDRVMKKVLAKDPDARYQTASQFAEDFSAAIHSGDSLVAVRKEQPLEQSDLDPSESVTSVQPKQGTTASAQPTAPFNPDTGTGPQTIIVQQGLDSRVILGGFLLIAVLILAVVVVLLMDQDDDTDDTPVRDTVSEVVRDRATDVAENGEGGINIPQVAATRVANATQIDAVGEASFSTTSSDGDTINLRVQQMPTLSNDQIYVGWLVNTRDDVKLNIGRVALDASGRGALVYTDEEGRFLPAEFNQLVITIEASDDANSDTPSDNVAFQGGYPIEVSDALQEIFVASEQGDNGRGLLASAIREGEFAISHSSLAIRAPSLGGLFTHAEHTMNIMLGGNQDYDGTGSSSNPGTGAGLEAYLNPIVGHVETVLAAEGADLQVQSQLEIINTCLQNVAFWATDAIEIELTVFEQESLEDAKAIQEEVAILVEHIVEGFDANENGSIEPTELECGLQQLETFGLLIANIAIVEME